MILHDLVYILTCQIETRTRSFLSSFRYEGGRSRHRHRQEQKQEIKEAFDLFDTDGSGGSWAKAALDMSDVS